MLHRVLSRCSTLMLHRVLHLDSQPCGSIVSTKMKIRPCPWLKTPKITNHRTYGVVRLHTRHTQMSIACSSENQLCLYKNKAGEKRKLVLP